MSETSNLSQEEQLKKLLESDEQYKSCKTDEQKQFLMDTMDSLLQRYGFEQTMKLLRMEKISFELVEVFKRNTASYGESMIAMSQVLASTIHIHKRNQQDSQRDLGTFVAKTIDLLWQIYNSKYSPEQIKFFKIFTDAAEIFNQNREDEKQNG